MEHLELLSKVLRYAGLNLNPQIISLILDEPVRTLVENLDSQLKENPNPSLEEIDAIVSEIQASQEVAKNSKIGKEPKKKLSKLDKV